MERAFNLVPLYASKKDSQDGLISVSGLKHVVRQWHRSLVGLSYFDALAVIQGAMEKNPECVYRVIRIDEVDLPGSKKDENDVNKNRVNFILATKFKFRNDMIQKQKRMGVWLAVSENQKNANVVGVEIY